MSGTLFAEEAELERLVVGPDSISWQIGSDPRLYAVMAYPLLLQVAHPTVGAGVRDFSDFEQRPWNRLLRTLDYVTLLIYGGDQAIPAGRRLRALHKGFKGVREDGEKYYALEPEAYAWVHATLIDSYVRGHRHFGRRLSTRDVERFYAEYRGLGRLVGVRERDLPPDWRGFGDYFNHTVGTELVRNESTDRVIRAIRHAPKPPVPVPHTVWRAARVPAERALWVGGIGLMSPQLRTRLGIDWTRRDELEFRALGAASRSAGPLLPQRFKVLGPAQLRMRRRAIARGPLGPDADVSATSAPPGAAVNTAPRAA